MKCFHLADLHIGKIINGFPMLPDQRHILAQVLRHAGDERPDAILIAGDVYDKSTPATDAVQLFDDFLTSLSKLGIPVLLISGNHDSAERLGFAARILEGQAIHLSGAFSGAPRVVTLHDAFGPVHFHLLPFCKPAHVRPYFPDAAIQGYGEAIAAALSATPIDTTQRNVLIAHQFAVAPGSSPERSDSEIEPVGGVDAISTALFDGFDYVALGHLHGPQRVGRDTIRYAGSPLKYSFSECNQRKSLTVVTLGEKGNVQVDTLPLAPLHDMRRLAGTMEEITAPEALPAGSREDYLQITLTDPDGIFDAIGKLRALYANIMELRFDNARTRAQADFSQDAAIREKTPQALFLSFFEAQNSGPPSAEQLALISPLLDAMEDLP